MCALASGTRFGLSQLPQYGDQRFTVLAVERHARNNLDTGIATLLGRDAMDNGGYATASWPCPKARRCVRCHTIARCCMAR
ncbi:hypothetical protein [Xanthomonas massiliensis]|uniref:hypothetical protein n=1 Tax=Xanthomonas massiliensis TaxID=1720302 RepID=UPI00082522CD|nr:hypothetical protein [Xanthomonas massiliensis]